jgi:hypothetical protein
VGRGFAGGGACRCGKWVEITTYADPLYQHLIVTAERNFWRCVDGGEPPRLFGVDPPESRIQAVRIVDMNGSNAWAEFAGVYPDPRPPTLSTSKPRPSSRA